MRNTRLSVLAVATGLFALFGCSLFPPATSSTSFSTGRPVLPPIQAAPDAVLLEIFFLERPGEDSLLSTGVWKEVDQIGALPTDLRESLGANGFRIGNVGSNPPPTVQKLLGMVAEIADAAADHAKPILGRRQYLSPGVETEIPTGIVHEQCHFELYDGQITKSLDYEQVSCVLRLKAHRLPGGWVRIDLQPEIHHGDRRMRRSATEEEWSLRMGQNVDVRLAQRFHLTMNVGELALITSTPSNDATLGDRFFRYEDQGMKKQRVLFIRVVESGQHSLKLAN